MAGEGKIGERKSDVAAGRNRGLKRIGRFLPGRNGSGEVGKETVGVVDELSRGITKDGESRRS